MAVHVSVPRAALNRLLRQAHSPCTTPEEWLAFLDRPGNYERYPSRARMAFYNLGVLSLATLVSGLDLIFSPSGEGLILTLSLIAVTATELRVRRKFAQEDETAPALGFYNQAALAGLIVLYGLANTIFNPDPTLPVKYQNMIDPETWNSIVHTERIVYLTISLLGGALQFALAWYYAKAKIDPFKPCGGSAAPTA